MPDKYSLEWVREQLRDKSWMPLRRCSLCYKTIGYTQQEGQLYFNSACGCSDHFEPEPRSWNSVVETLEMQSSDEMRDRIIATLKGDREPA
jgi:7,8-dihydro-6-hydroxymethylpterin-pyrophosphokinase